MSKVFVSNKKGMMLVDMNETIEMMFYKEIGHKRVSVVKNGERYLVSVPVVTRLSLMEMMSMLLCAVVGGGFVYLLMVLMIGLAPLNR